MENKYFYVKDLYGSSIHINPDNKILKELKVELPNNSNVDLKFIIQLLDENEYRTHVFYTEGGEYKYFFEYDDPSSQSFYRDDPIVISEKDIITILQQKIATLDEFGQYAIQTINKYHSYLKLDKLPNNKKNIKNNKI